MQKKHLIGYPVAVLVALGIGAASASGGDATTPVASPVPTTTVTQTQKVTPPPGPTVFKTVTAKAEPPKPKTVIDEGVWEVGSDVPAGKYKVIEPITADQECYWSITKGSGDNIVDNGLPTGGRPSVTLRKGQTFTTQDCGQWGKVG